MVAHSAGVLWFAVRIMNRSNKPGKKALKTRLVALRAKNRFHATKPLSSAIHVAAL